MGGGGGGGGFGRWALPAASPVVMRMAAAPEGGVCSTLRCVACERCPLRDTSFVVCYSSCSLLVHRPSRPDTHPPAPRKHFTGGALTQRSQGGNAHMGVQGPLATHLVFHMFSSTCYVGLASGIWFRMRMNRHLSVETPEFCTDPTFFECITSNGYA